MGNAKLVNKICREFEQYIQETETIFDIMAAAYKLVSPFESNMYQKADSALQNMICCFKEEYNKVYALTVLKSSLSEWICSLYASDEKEIKAKLFGLIRLIDQKCADVVKWSLPEPYIHVYALNHLLQDEIMILPRLRNSAMDVLSKTVADQEKYGFYGRNYARTKDVSGYMYNFIIYSRRFDIKPVITILNYDKEMRNIFEQKDYKLLVAAFPLSNKNLRKIFQLEENVIDERGTFCISGVEEEQEKLILKRCINALEKCRDQGVDIAVFPEMLFTEKNWKEIRDYVRNHESKEKRFPLFTWLGTAWSQNENKCMVIDRYGNEVFVQKKRVPYEYTKREGGKKIKLTEALSYDGEWVVNFLDLSGFLRIATAICRDVSDHYLTTGIKELYSDMVIIPAFSSTDRLTDGYVNPLVLDRINVIACNACSAYCPEEEEQYEINEEQMAKPLPFCYLCMTAKETQKNTEDIHHAVYKPSCMQCEDCCKGFLWEIDFNECVWEEGKYAAKVVNLNL